MDNCLIQFLYYSYPIRLGLLGHFLLLIEVSRLGYHQKQECPSLMGSLHFQRLCCDNLDILENGILNMSPQVRILGSGTRRVEHLAGRTFKATCWPLMVIRSMIGAPSLLVFDLFRKNKTLKVFLDDIKHCLLAS